MDVVIDGLEGVHKADALEGLVFAGGFVEGVLDVHGGDVVGQEHDFVAVEFVGVLVRQGGLGDAPHEVDDEIAGAGEGVEDVDVARRRGILPKCSQAGARRWRP